MKSVVTGGAGYIGSNLVDALEAAGHEVVVVDDFSTGSERFLCNFSGELHRVNLTDESLDLRPIFDEADTVYHMAANADVRFGWNDTRRDLQQNVVATLRVAEAAAAVGVNDVVFSSTGSVYGEAAQIPTPENTGFPDQTSLYGASKVAAEGYLGAFAANGAFRVTVFRFVSVLGPRYTHGHVIDFVRQLTADPENLTVLGNGTQRKSYMHVTDCVRGVQRLRATNSVSGAGKPFGVFNLGCPQYCTVLDSIGWITARMGVDPDLHLGDGDRGWVGDNPFIFLDVAKAEKEGWVPHRGIRESVEETVDWILANQWALSMTDSRAN